MCEEKDLEVSTKWYAHVPEKVVEPSDVKILWDFNIQKDHDVEQRRPDVVLDKKANSCHLVDIAVPADSRKRGEPEDLIEGFIVATQEQSPRTNAWSGYCLSYV